MSCQSQCLFYPALLIWFLLIMENWTWTGASKKESHFNLPQPSLCFLKPIINMAEERISSVDCCRTVHQISIFQYKKNIRYKLKFNTKMEPPLGVWNKRSWTVWGKKFPGGLLLLRGREGWGGGGGCRLGRWTVLASAFSFCLMRLCCVQHPGLIIKPLPGLIYSENPAVPPPPPTSSLAPGYKIPITQSANR